MEMLTAPTIKITGNVEPRMVTTKNGMQKQVFTQAASFSKEGMQLPTEIEVDGPQNGYRIGEVLAWDVVADLTPGQFGRLELARKKTLRPVNEASRPARRRSANAMAVLVQACMEADFDAATQTCTAPYWIPQPTVLPALSVADAQQIGLAIAFLLACAWVIRRVKKQIDQS